MKKIRTTVLLMILIVGLFPLTPVEAREANECSAGNYDVLVRFTYGSEKYFWIHEVTETFNSSGYKTKAGKKICVNAIPKGSGDSVNEIRNGQAGPSEVHITSPASDLYIQLINHEYKQAQGQDLLRRAKSLVTSPVVIAMWEPIARKLGWPDQPIGWQDLFEAAKDPNFRYGQTSPEQSNSGLSALIAQFYAGAQLNNQGRPVRVLTLNHIEDPEVRNFVERVHDSVIHYGNSTGFYARNMINAGPNYADAAVLYESDVIIGNNTIQTTLRGKYPRLIAGYPAEGTFETNHPFAFVQREWVDEEEREAAEIYYEYLLQPEQQAKALTKGFRPTVSLDIEDSIYAQLWNPDYGVADFKTTHRYLPAPTGEVITAARNAFRDLKKQSHVVLVMDKSGSMDKVDTLDESQAIRMTRAIEGAKLVIDNLQPVDRVNVVVFDHRSRFLPETPPGKPLHADSAGKTTLKRSLDRLRPGGNTAMFDAIVEAWESLCAQIKQNPNDRAIRAIILLTDGQDTASSRYKNPETVIQRIGYAQEKPGGGYYGDAQCKIAVFAIAYVDSSEGGQHPLLTSLEAIAESTRGDAKEGGNVSIMRLFQEFGDFL